MSWSVTYILSQVLTVVLLAILVLTILTYDGPLSLLSVAAGKK